MDFVNLADAVLRRVDDRLGLGVRAAESSHRQNDEDREDQQDDGAAQRGLDQLHCSPIISLSPR